MDSDLAPTRVSLVSPNNAGSYRSAQIVAENLGIAYLASYVEARGHDVQLVDARILNQEPTESASAVMAFGPSVLGVSLISEQAVPWTSSFLSRFASFPDGPLCIVGGYFPTLQPERALQLMPRVDAVVLGEGELILEQLLQHLADSSTAWRDIPGICVRSVGDLVHRNPRHALLRDLDQLPWPRRYAAPHANDAFDVLIEASRGCTLACTFCAIRPFFRAGGESAWRCRSPDNVVEEMIAVRRVNPRLRKFRFVDPDFLGFDAAGAERASRLADLIAERLPGIEFYIEVRAPSVIANPHTFRRLRDAGLREVFIGVESGSQRILDYFHKRTTVAQVTDAVATLKGMGITVHYGFMMFTPWTQEDDLRASIDLLRTIGSVEFDKLFHEMDVIPGTPAFAQLRIHGSIVPKDGTGYYTYSLNGPEERLRRCGRALESRQRAFMEDVWLLYKDAQRAVQTGLPGASELERRVSDLNLAMFQYCVDTLRPNAGQQELSAEDVADACAATFADAVRTLDAAMKEQVRFPRPGSMWPANGAGHLSSE